MTLSPHERQTLREIESQLIRCDPKLAAMLTQWTVRCARFRAALTAMKRCALHGKHARLVWITMGLALVVGLAIAGACTAHPVRPPGRGQRSVSRVLPDGFHPNGGGHPDPLPARSASLPY